MSYFNTFCFPIAALVRLKEKLLHNSTASGTAIPANAINKLFKAIFSAEHLLLRRFNFPFGVSLLCVLQAADAS